MSDLCKCDSALHLSPDRTGWFVASTVLAIVLIVPSYSRATDREAAVQIVAGPWLQAATETSIVVMWETSDAEAGSVEFGVTRQLGESKPSMPVRVPAAETNDDRFQDTPAILHEVKLTGLVAGQSYFYRVRAGDAASPIYSFHTNRQSGPFRFVTTSNTHAFERAEQRRKMELIADISVDFIINQGDQTQQSMNREYRKQMQGSAASSSTTVWYSTRGNHENRTWSCYTSWYHNEFPGHRDESYYSFDIGNMHFVVLNEAPTRSRFPEQWLRDDLSRTGKKWKVILAKKPPHLFGKTWLYEIFEESGVDVMLAADCGTRSGHWPQPYEGDNAKHRGVWYLTNCGGYQVVETDGDVWNVETFDSDGTSRVKVRVTKR